MAERFAWAEELRRRDRAEWPAFLKEHSGLPGPRANLELLVAVAELAGPADIRRLREDGDEYLAMCAAAAVSRRADHAELAETAHALASDERWRVREGVATGLQLLGDTSPEAMARIVGEWAGDPDPLVQRAAAAAICEPRLLRDPVMSATAIEVCRRTTAQLVSLTPAERKAPGARVLRQALAYCWSVAVAADPEKGTPVFLALDTGDADVSWLVEQNRRKKRLSKLL